MKNKKGFTLIELLAVIVILGILMMAAIPAITRTIAKSRRNTYWQNAKQYIKAATTPYLDGEYAGTSSTTCNLPGQGKFVLIPQSIVELEQGSIEKSSFNAPYVTDSGTEASAGTPTIMVANVPIDGRDNLQWFYTGMDKQNNGIKEFVNMNELSLKSVSTGSASTIKGTAVRNVCIEYNTSQKTYKVTVLASATAECSGSKIAYDDTCKVN